MKIIDKLGKTNGTRHFARKGSGNGRRFDPVDRDWGATTIRPTPTWWCEVTAFSLIYGEYPANYGIRTTSPLALNKAGLLERRPVQMKGLAFCAIDSSEALSP
jgi:hypothetical protein